MPFHHLALATHDMRAIDVFYTQAMGFTLVKVEVAATPEGGWAKHFFYDTGRGEMMAFWELHDDSLPSDFATSLSGAVGLPPWTNHIAFDPGSMGELQTAKKRWLELGYGVMEIDHNWCYSIYTRDPNGTLVEWCVTTAEFSEADAAKARKAVISDDVERETRPPAVTMHKAELRPLHKRLAEAEQG